ncbi:hypothetical protein [Dietzia maris]|uniref:hypothetical protein n=1 Tax=Dietzia maris TaxID=37915 RepID=UPI0037CB820A
MILDFASDAIKIIFIVLAAAITFGAAILAVNRNPIIGVLSLPVAFIACVIMGGLYPDQTSHLVVAWPLGVAALGLAVMNTFGFRIAIPPRIIPAATSGGAIINAGSVAPAAASGPVDAATASRHWASA